MELNEQILQDYWRKLIDPVAGDAAGDQAQRYFIQAVQQAVDDISGDVLNLKGKGWRVTVKEPLAKSVIMLPAVGALLYYFGIEQVPSIILTLLPCLFDVKNIELDRKEETIWLRLSQGDSKLKYKTAGDWYESLPQKLKDQIHPLDFDELMDKLVMGGFAKEKDDERYKVLKKGKHILKITFN